jgi:hypothetical protein
MINLEKAKAKGIISRDYVDHNLFDTVNDVLEAIRAKYELEFLIVSGTDDYDWECMLGTELNTGMSYIVANGTGKEMLVAVSNCINEFIDYYGFMDKNEIKTKKGN